MSFSKRKRELLKPKKEQYLKTFLLALLTASVLFVPFMIKDNGYFLFYGDFNVQQIPFYKLSHDAVLSGQTGWHFGTDLGVNFIGSYTFYLLGSPFFLLTLLFPSNMVPYLMGPLLILKFSLAALTAYCFIRRFTRTPDAACLGGLLYAFSGFSIYNIFFNHFHEAIIIFPLVLLSLELLITENKRGFFAAMVAVSALVNYFFFFGIVVFTIIYWFVRLLSGSYKLPFSRFAVIMFEAVLGFLMSAVLLLPSFLALVNNSRLTEFQLGWGAIMYGKEQIYANILQSFFFPPDIPARPVFFPEADVKWSSVAGWLPVFSMVSVFAVFMQKKKSFIKRILGISVFMALVPVLNSAFYMFNGAYYARWFYMPILIMCLATATTIEDKTIDFKSPFRWVFGITLAVSLVIGLFPKETEEGLSLGLFTYEAGSTMYIVRYIVACAIALLGLVALKVILPLLKTNFKKFTTASIALVVVFSMVYGVVFIVSGKSHSYQEKEVLIDQLLESEVNLAKNEEYRIDVHDGVDNTAMYLGYDSINAFHSIVPASVTEFWEYIGEERGVASRPSYNSYAARSLLSVKYMLDRVGREDDSGFEDEAGITQMSGYTYYKTEGGYKVYLNQNYIPYGFTYDYYTTRRQADALAESDRANLMVKAILLEDNQVIKYDDILTDISLKDTKYDPNYIAKMESLEEPEVSSDNTLQNETDSSNIDSSNQESIINSEEIPDNIIEEEKNEILNGDVLELDFSELSLKTDASMRARTSGSFKKQKNGFVSEITLDKDNLVFFSIPYDEGWKAYVNGKEVEIEKVNVGFMAVLAQEGQNTIEFKYTTPGLKHGILITFASLIVFVIYLIVSGIYIKKKQYETAYPEGEKMLEIWQQDEAEEIIKEQEEVDYWEEIEESKKEEPTVFLDEDLGFKKGFTINLDIDENEEDKE